MNCKKEYHSHINKASLLDENPNRQQAVALPKTNHAKLEGLLHSLLGPDIENSDLHFRENPVNSHGGSTIWSRRMRVIQVLTDLEDTARVIL
jgi:hypothetical protein